MKRTTFVLLIVIVFSFVIYLTGETVQMANQKATTPNIEKEKHTLLELDSAMSDVSEEKGLFEAFYPFLDEQSVIFPANGHPICGQNACAKLMEKVNSDKENGKIKWYPLKVLVSLAGDIAYTNGNFERIISSTGTETKPVIHYYVTIWKKNSTGHWKIAVSQGLLFVNDLNQPPVSKQFKEANLSPTLLNVINTERAFSKYSMEQNRLGAFYNYIDDKGIAISGGTTPRFKENYSKALADLNEKKEAVPSLPRTTLEWEPFFAYLSQSEDYAFDYGPYTYTEYDATGGKKLYYGYFITVWKKQPDNSWKFIMDCGNESPTPAKK